ncbi:MAG: RadC family protein [Thermodesulfobacteriota bacterium]
MENSGAHKGEGHRRRLREKFLSSGLSGFHDYEVIELLLSLATPRKDCKGPAKEVLGKFGTLPAVLESSSRELCEIPGIGPKNVFGLKLIKAVADRYLERKVSGRDVIHHSRELYEYLLIHYGSRRRECFVVVFLDAKNRVMGMETLFEGTLTASSVYPREVVRAALERNAAALIFAHNHPSGDPAPSAEDMAVTRRLVSACRVVGLTVHEHIIVGDNCYFSFADHGHMERLNRE